MEFLSALASYVLLMLLFVVLGGCAIAVGITLRKKKNAKEAMEQAPLEEN